ncbi:transporter [Corynebacterium yudongzhengii]|uniref:Transporter n=1 Tax=Corynebacterium yudongzhengii TaxID=2080740 RepID=A0A2U1T9G2_9CORY|nr:transporter [Corynebacterium yudongzhengii]AWB82125.1 transporter [Corynebacterium yudongzhengii]PWC02629.1 transporter [Corynebacterium yudongzhengii]
MTPMVFFGLVASVALLFAFAMLNLGKWTADSYPYQALNFLGAAFLAASAFEPFNAGVFWTEVLWSLLGLYGLIRIYVTKRAPEEGRPQARPRCA